MTPRAVPRRAPGTGRTTMSKHADITLQDDNIDLIEGYEDDLRKSPYLGDDTGIGSQDFRAGSYSALGIDDQLDLGLDLDLDVELDLGLDLDNDIDVDNVDNRESNLDLLGSSSLSSSPAAKQRTHTSGTGAGPSRIVSIAAHARAREGERSSSEGPSVEIGRDAAQPRSARDSIASELLSDAGLQRDDSLFGVGGGDTSLLSDNAGPAFQPNEFEFGGNDMDFDLGRSSK